MGIFSKVKKKLKKVFKSVKKTFGGIGKAFGKLMQNKWIRYAAIAGALVFTAGVATAAFPALGSTSLMSTLSSSGLTGGIFSAGQGFASTIGIAAAQTGTVTGAEVGSALTGAGEVSFGGAPLTGASVGGELGVGTAIADAGAAVGAAVPASTAASQVAAMAPSAASGGILSKAANAGAKVLDYTASNPGAALLAGNVIESMSTPSQYEEAKKLSKYQRGLDWRGGVNNLTGESAYDLTEYRDSLSGLLSQAQNVTQSDQATGEYSGQLRNAPTLPNRPLNVPAVNYPTASGQPNTVYPQPPAPWQQS